MESTSPTREAIPSSDDQNPGVDRDLLARAAELWREVEKFGLVEEPGYSIAPALGGTVIRKATGARTAARRSPFSSVVARAR